MFPLLCAGITRTDHSKQPISLDCISQSAIIMLQCLPIPRFTTFHSPPGTLSLQLFLSEGANSHNSGASYLSIYPSQLQHLQAKISLLF